MDTWDDAAELAQLVGEQQADDANRQWPQHRRSVSLDTPVAYEDGSENGNVGTELIGYDPWEAIDDALDDGLDPLETPDVYADSTRVVATGTGWLPHHLRDHVWDEKTLGAHGGKTGSPHEFRDTPRDPRNPDRPTQFEQAYGTRRRRRANSQRVAPAILAKLFACITIAVGADAAYEAAARRGRPSPADQIARTLAAVAVQAFREMGYTTAAIARALQLPPRTVARYTDPELLPVLSREALERLFGGSLAAADSEVTSVPTSEHDATRGQLDGLASASPAQWRHADGLDQMSHPMKGRA